MPTELKTEPSLYTKQAQAHYAAIVELNDTIGELAMESAVAADDAKTKKKRYEAAVEKLRTLIAAGPDQQPKLPGMLDVEWTDDWKRLALSELGLPAGIEAAFNKAGIETIGQLFKRIDGENWWEVFAGIGESKADQVVEAFAAFWEAHPKYCKATRPMRIRITHDFDDCDLHDGEVHAVVEWQGDGYPVVQPEGSPRLYLDEGDWEAVEAEAAE